jgi:DNA-binding CsgD family transcriptional regulator
LRREDRFIRDIKTRCCFLYDMETFKEKLMMPFREFYPHDSSGVIAAHGAGFDQKGIIYGYPPQYVIDWINQEPQKVRRFAENFREGPSRGYHTLSSTTIRKNIPGEAETLRLRYEPYGYKHAVQTMFFDSSGSPMGVYAYMRKSDPEISEVERQFFDGVAPFIFYAFRKYKYLLEIEFFTSPSLDSLFFGIVATDHANRIVWQNHAAGDILSRDGEETGKLPKELKKAGEMLNTIQSNREKVPLIFRTLESPTPFGSVVSFRVDEYGAKYLPCDEEGTVHFIDPRNLDRDIVSTLSRRELQVVRLISKGMHDKEIAEHLSISEKTVQTYTASLFMKLGVSNRTEAAVKIMKLGI